MLYIYIYTYTNRYVGFWRRRCNKGHESLPRRFFFCDARDRRICGFREIKDRKKKVQCLIVPKDSPTVRQGVPICSPTASDFFFFSIYPLFGQVGHSIRARIHLHRAHRPGAFVTRVSPGDSSTLIDIIAGRPWSTWENFLSQFGFSKVFSRLHEHPF